MENEALDNINDGDMMPNINPIPTKEELASFYKRFIKAKDQYTAINRNSEGYGYSYADLDAVIKATDPALHAQNILVEEERFKDKLYIYLVDAESGCKFLKFKGTITPVVIKDKQGNAKNNLIQQEGAAVTYLRRYGRMVALGVATEDDDGESLTDDKNNKAPAKQKYSATQLIEWHKQVVALVNDGKVTDADKTKLSQLKTKEIKDEYGDLLFSIIRDNRVEKKDSEQKIAVQKRTAIFTGN